MTPCSAGSKPHRRCANSCGDMCTSVAPQPPRPSSVILHFRYPLATLEDRMKQLLNTLAVCTLLQLAAAPSASAQINLSGIWAPIMHEDASRARARPRHRRLSRPADHRRRRACAATLGRLAPDDARAHVQAAPVHLRLPRRRQPAHLGQLRPHDASADRRSTRTSSGWSSAARSGWTAVRIRPTSIRTPGRASRPAAGKATCWSSTTTHLKAGWMRRNGLALSDRATHDGAVSSVTATC